LLFARDSGPTPSSLALSLHVTRHSPASQHHVDAVRQASAPAGSSGASKSDTRTMVAQTQATSSANTPRTRRGRFTHGRFHHLGGRGSSAAKSAGVQAADLNRGFGRVGQVSSCRTSSSRDRPSHSSPRSDILAAHRELHIFLSCPLLGPLRHCPSFQSRNRHYSAISRQSPETAPAVYYQVL